MFGWFTKKRSAKLRKRYEETMGQAMELQRKGDIPAFAVKRREAEDLLEQAEAAEAAGE